MQIISVGLVCPSALQDLPNLGVTHCNSGGDLNSATKEVIQQRRLTVPLEEAAVRFLYKALKA